MTDVAVAGDAQAISDVESGEVVVTQAGGDSAQAVAINHVADLFDHAAALANSME